MDTSENGLEIGGMKIPWLVIIGGGVGAILLSTLLRPKSSASDQPSINDQALLMTELDRYMRDLWYWLQSGNKPPTTPTKPEPSDNAKLPPPISPPRPTPTPVGPPQQVCIPCPPGKNCIDLCIPFGNTFTSANPNPPPVYLNPVADLRLASAPIRMASGGPWKKSQFSQGPHPKATVNITYVSNDNAPRRALV